MKKINKEKIFETAIQIFLLMIYIFAFSYIIDSISKEIKPVSADSGSQCCAKTNSGAICQNIPAQECESECSDSCQFTTCENSVECKPGCCITKEGNCAASSPKASCELGGGEWVDGSACNIGDCIKGCCVLGSETVFTTEKNCEFLTLSFGFEQQDFRGNMRTELECLALREVQKQGACVFEQDKINTCKFTSQQECVKLTGNSLNFYENFLCSHPGLNTNCEKQISTGCLETNDEVYWFDSCGNRENIYSSDKETSWNNGMVLKKEESCSPTLSNINSKDCGNCNYLLSSKCYKAEDVKPDVGEYICKDMSCVDNKGKKHSNGESWCVYDGAIGKGRDLVGSRHFKMSCINGEIKNEPCADYRNEICVQSNIQTERQVISSASCVINKWQMCIEGSGCKAGSRDCFAQSITLSKEIDTINSCLPNYPPGFDLTTREGEDYARKLCGIASYKCTAVLVDGECESNCECLLPEFSEKMHNWCTSLGDCGYKKNIIGESTKNEYLSGAPDARSPVGIVGQQQGNYAQPDSIQTLESLGIKQSYAKSSEGKTPKEEADLAWLKMAMGISGASGMVLMWVAPYLTTYTVGGTMVVTAVQAAAIKSVGGTVVTSGMGPTVAAFASFLTGAAIGATVGYFAGMYAAKSAGIQGRGAGAVAAGGAIAGAIAGGVQTYLLSTVGINAWFASFGQFLLSFGVVLFWAAVAIIIMIILVKCFGLFGGSGEIEKRIVEFRCMPWEAPVGGGNCDKCNGDELKPCSKYRCESL
ncbi:MAG: hypothetical protein KJ559_02635, partial [Nanoarchaeota archaeon]|nr:hypothetical protein [Nanoarchaeota archaeon]